MKIQNRLTLLFSFLFGIILFGFIVGVYQFYSNRSREDYFQRLHLKAALKVDLIDGETIAPDVLHAFYENIPPNYEPQVTIYGEDGRLIYRDKKNALPEKEYRDLLPRIHKSGPCCVWHEDKQIYGFAIEGYKTNYIVFATGKDVRGEEQLQTLKMVFAVAYLIVMLFIVLTVRLLTKQAFRPVARMTAQVKDITHSNQLNIRLDEGNRKDELAGLAITFNRMIAQLEKAFNAQKQFVYNISHELRTPLSAIITELELSQNKPNSKKEDYEAVVDLVLKDARRLAKLSNNLLDMAKTNYSPTEIAMHEIRLDELLIDVCHKIRKSSPGYTVQLIFDKTDIEDDRLISVKGNEYLLSVALGNLIDNGCKFSPDRTCEVHISYENQTIIIRVIDQGIGISEKDMESIFTPFFRGENQSFAEGNGIGLSLTHKIIQMHQGEIHVTSQPGETLFTVKLSNLC
ncbi:ATP-binding protein [Bacteroides reticulotermitis]|uniref:sensor histidine kinase n=1 Tax=Bacteroides reticulotermitis TaxID=1133319 RepID=UPI001D48B45D|nr:HAMP domain-containing histidine kinase [Bacteroides reticulotermitis]